MATYSWRWSEVGKFVATSIVSVSTASTVREIIRNNVEPETAIGAAKIKIASGVVGFIVFTHMWDGVEASLTRIEKHFNELSKDRKVAPVDVAADVKVEPNDTVE